MSCEQSVSCKTLGPGGSTSASQQKSPSPSNNASPKSSPSRSGVKLSLKGLGRSSTSAKNSKSPVRRQQTLVEGGKEKDKKTSSKLPEFGDDFEPGTSGPSCVDSLYEANASSSCSSPHKQSAANKIIHNWKSACKDKTKDFIRRWKTLPENHPDFEAVTAGRTSPLLGESRSSSPVGSGANICSSAAPTAGTTITTTVSAGGPCTSAVTGAKVNSSSNLVEMVNPSQSNPGAGGSGSGPGGSKFSKKKGGEASEVTSGFQALSLGGKSGSVSFGPTGNGPFGDDGINGSKPSGWSVHVWATYVQRGDDVTINEDKPPARDFLSDFQKMKLTHFFRHVLDMNHDDVISAEDFVALNQRIRHYIEWSSECIEFHILKEVHSGFLECFLNQPLDDSSVMYYCHEDKETRESVNIDAWLDVWGELLNGKRVLETLPLWLQYFPKILFQVINKSGSGTISKEQLRAFYTMFLGIDFRVVNDTLDSIYNAMTDSGRNKITYTLFKLCFTNFLLGKFPHGPGQYLFGICAPATLSCAFPIDYSALNTPKDDLEPYDPDKDNRASNRRLK